MLHRIARRAITSDINQPLHYRGVRAEPVRAGPHCHPRGYHNRLLRACAIQYRASQVSDLCLVSQSHPAFQLPIPLYLALI